MKNIGEIPNIKLAESLAWVSQITSESALSKSLEDYLQIIFLMLILKHLMELLQRVLNQE